MNSAKLQKITLPPKIRTSTKREIWEERWICQESSGNWLLTLLDKDQRCFVDLKTYYTPVSLGYPSLDSLWL